MAEGAEGGGGEGKSDVPVVIGLVIAFIILVWWIFLK